MTKKPLFALALALLLAPAVALAADPSTSTRGKPTPDQILRNPKLLARYLQLTPDQVAKAQPLYVALATTLKNLHDAEQPLALQLETLLQGSNPSACDVGAIVVQIDGLHDQARTALQTFDTAFSALLTPEQLAKYDALKVAAHLGDGVDPTSAGS